MTITDSWGVGIRAVGTYLPDKILTNYDLEQMVDTTDDWIRSHIGVVERRIAADDQLSSDLGARALLDACAKSGINPLDIDLIISGSNTPDHISPQTACRIIDKSGSLNAAGFDVKCGGCAGGVVALDVGSQYVATGRYKMVAVVLAEVTSKIVNWNDRTTCVILGDGAACYLLSPCIREKGLLRTFIGNQPSGYFAAYVPAGGRAMPITQDVIDKGLDCFVMDGKAVWNFAHEVVPGLFRKLAFDLGMEPKDADLLIMHQANKTIVNNVMSMLEVPPEKAFCNIEKLGNTSSASVPLALAGALNAGLVKNGSLILMVSFGAGLTYGATAIRWCDPTDFILDARS